MRDVFVDQFGQKGEYPIRQAVYEQHINIKVTVPECRPELQTKLRPICDWLYGRFAIGFNQ